MIKSNKISQLLLSERSNTLFYKKYCTKLTSKPIPDVVPTSVGYFSTKTPEIANSIIKIISSHISPKSRFYIVNPGKNFITPYLFENVKQEVNIFECYKNNSRSLQALIKKNEYPIKNISQLNFFDVTQTYLLKQHKNQNWNHVDIKADFKTTWSEAPCAQLFAIVPFKYESGFLHNSLLQLQYNHAESLFSHGRIEFLFYISGREATYMQTALYDKPPYRSFWYNYASIGYKIFYDIEFLDKQDLSNFVPDMSPVLLKKTRPKFDYSQMHLVKMVPKPDIYDNWTHQDIKQFFAFTKMFLRRPSSIIIKNFFINWMGSHQYKRFLEQYVTSPAAIKLFQYEKPCELMPEQIVELFRLFQLTPEYDLFLGPLLLAMNGSRGYNKLGALNQELSPFLNFETNSQKTLGQDNRPKQLNKNPQNGTGNTQVTNQQNVIRPINAEIGQSFGENRELEDCYDDNNDFLQQDTAKYLLA